MRCVLARWFSLRAGWRIRGRRSRCIATGVERIATAVGQWNGAELTIGAVALVGFWAVAVCELVWRSVALAAVDVVATLIHVIVRGSLIHLAAADTILNASCAIQFTECRVTGLVVRGIR